MKRSHRSPGARNVAFLLIVTLLLSGALYAAANPPRATASPFDQPQVAAAPTPTPSRTYLQVIGATTDLRGYRLNCVGGAARTDLTAPAPDATAPYSQTFVLQPGWNAIYLELAPQPNGIAEALAGLPVGCVFSHRGRPDRTPRAYQPGSAKDTNLYTLEPNQAYLIKLDGSAPVTWTVYGRPALETATWTPNSFNELGLPVDPAHPPSFRDLFGGSTASKNMNVLRLEPSGRSGPVDPVAAVRAGEAYRIYSAGQSSYAGPLAVTADQGKELQYGRTLVERSLTIRNESASPQTATVRQLDSPVPVPLLYRVFDPARGTGIWKPLTGTLTLPQDIIVGDSPATLAPQEEVELRLAVRRADLPAGVDLAESVLEIGDGAGKRALVAVSVQPQVAAAPAAEAARGITVDSSPNQFAGLWVGTVAVNQVGVANAGEPGKAATTPVEPTASAFQFRVLIHVDASGQARLLKEAILVRDPVSGQDVLLSDSALAGQFAGSGLRDGEAVNRRVSSAAYDFAGDDTKMPGTVQMQGQAGEGGALDVVLKIASDLPTNPFLHRYHPDHDNLKAGTGEPLPADQAEAYAVQRDLSFTFTDAQDRGQQRSRVGRYLARGHLR